MHSHFKEPTHVRPSDQWCTSLVGHIFSFSTQETEACESLKIQGQADLYTEFQASKSYTGRSYFNNNINNSWTGKSKPKLDIMAAWVSKSNIATQDHNGIPLPGKLVTVCQSSNPLDKHSLSMEGNVLYSVSNDFHFNLTDDIGLIQGGMAVVEF